jgi:AcrR family transcriptional regulator
MSDSPRPALSRERIAATALELIDANGLTGLSMRKLGAELGVEAMSLYHYITNKNDLLDAVADHLYGEIELPVSIDPQDWETAIRLGLRSFHDVLLEHEAALELFASRQIRSERSVQVLHWAHERFVAVGLSVEEAHKALHMGVSFVMGHAVNETGTGSVRPANAVDVSAEMDAYFRHIESVTSDELFDAGLDLVVAGLRQRYRLS